MNLTKKLLLLFLISFLFCWTSSMKVYSAAGDEVVINTSPDKQLFILADIAPGDTITKILTVQNRGARNFEYISNVSLKSGALELYNELVLRIEDANSQLYNGKLKDFVGFPKRLLHSLQQEDLKITVEFPLEKGNEFKGLSSEVEFVFTAKDLFYESPIDPVTPDNPQNPTDPDQPEKPENPENPKDPDTSNPPSQPDESTIPPSNDEEQVKPERPISGEDLESEPVDGQILPITASNIFHNLFVGLGLLTLGLFLRFLQLKLKTKTKHI
jgi:hypothetical protein